MSFDTAGGNEIGSIYVNNGGTLDSLPVPERSGHDFKGWYIGVTKVQLPYTVTSDVTLTAKWQVRSHMISFDSAGGTPVEPISGNYRDVVTELPTPTKEGHTFLGWFVGDAKIELPYPITGDVTFLAKWAPLQFTVEFDTRGGDPINSVTVDYGTEITLPIPNRPYYIFVRWEAEGESLSGTYVVTKDVTITAVWINETKKVTFRFNNGTPDKVTNQPVNEPITLPQTPTRTNWQFMGYEINGVKLPTFYVVTKDIVVDAYWGMKTTISWDPNKLYVTYVDPVSGDGFTKTSPYNLVIREFTKVYDAFPNMPNHSLGFGYPARQILNPQVYHSSTLYSMYSINDYVNEYNNVFWLDVITDVDVELSIFVDGSYIHTTTQRTPDIIKHQEMHEYMQTPLAPFDREYLTDGEFDGDMSGNLSDYFNLREMTGDSTVAYLNIYYSSITVKVVDSTNYSILDQRGLDSTETYNRTGEFIRLKKSELSKLKSKAEILANDNGLIFDTGTYNGVTLTDTTTVPATSEITTVTLKFKGFTLSIYAWNDPDRLFVVQVYNYTTTRHLATKYKLFLSTQPIEVMARQLRINVDDLIFMYTYLKIKAKVNVIVKYWKASGSTAVQATSSIMVNFGARKAEVLAHTGLSQYETNFQANGMNYQFNSWSDSKTLAPLVTGGAGFSPNFYAYGLETTLSAEYTKHY